jgi:hypothetical protein
MAKTEPPKQETPPTPPPAPKKKEKKEKKPKPTIEVPPVVDMTISFSRTATLSVTVIVALFSLSAGADFQTIFVRSTVALIVSGLLLWLISWWVAHTYLENAISKENNQQEISSEGLIKDIKA